MYCSTHLTYHYHNVFCDLFPVFVLSYSVESTEIDLSEFQEGTRDLGDSSGNGPDAPAQDDAQPIDAASDVQFSNASE